MSAAYLIDGYNLLFAQGLLLTKATPPGHLEWARGRLLAMLHQAIPADAAAVTVVFDAANATRHGNDHHFFHAIEVRFAVTQGQADDLIEDLIRQCANPKQLTVVSNDHRIQRAARRRDCRVLECGAFLDQLDRIHREARARPPEAPEKRDGVSDAEARQWLREFGDIEGDPEFRQLFEKYDFED